MPARKGPDGAGRIHPRASRRQKPPNHFLQFLLALSAGVFVIGSVVTWKVCAEREHWHAWSIEIRKGFFGFRDSRSEASEAANRDGLAKHSVGYRGDGFADLGRFSVGQFDAATGTTLRVNFMLQGMTRHPDEPSFDRFMQENHRAFREQVMLAIRDCRASDFADAQSLGNKVKTRINRAFGETILDSAHLDDFAVYESVANYGAEPWRTAEEELAEQSASN